MAVASALASRPAGAADAVVCPAAGATWLRVTFGGDGFTPPLRARVLEQLGADLRRHDLALCDASDAPSDQAPATAAPLADIVLALSPDSVLSLEVRDAVTDKRMTRELPLGSVPRDALALSIALAAEELLRASWIEAALATSSSATSPAEPPKAVPPAVQAVNAEQIARILQRASADGTGPEPSRVTPGAHVNNTPNTAQVALLGAAERSTGGGAVDGQTDLGGDVRFSYGGRLMVTARFGIRAAPDVTSTHGSVHGSELLGGLGLTYALLRREASWGAEIGARADALDVQFTGVAASPASARTALAASGSALGAVVSGVAGGWGRLGGPWRVIAEAALGAPVRAVRASDEGTIATGVSGVSIGVALGVAATLSD